MKNFKKVIAMLLVATMALSLVACGSKEEAPAEEPKTEEEAPAEEPAAEGEYAIEGLDEVTIVFSSAAAPSTIDSIYANRFMEVVTEKSNGQIKFDYTDGGVLGTLAELAEGIVNGVCDMTVMDVANFQSWVPETKLVSMPCLFDGYEHADRVYDGEFATYIEDALLEKAGVEVLNWEYAGFREILSKDPITSLADCEGVIIRSPEVETYTTMMNLIGFTYVTMASSEMYTSLNTGIIDAIEQPLNPIYEQGFYEIANNLLMSNHIFNTISLHINADFMNNLPEAYQQIIRDAAEEIEAEERAKCKADEEGYIAKMEEAGCTITEWDQESYDELQVRFQEYWGKVAAEVGGEDALQMIIDAK